MKPEGASEPGRTRCLALACLLPAACGLFLFGIDWGLPNSSSWAANSLQPTLLLYGLRLGFMGEWASMAYLQYPRFHFVLLSAVSAPYLLLLEIQDPDLLQYLLGMGPLESLEAVVRMSRDRPDVVEALTGLLILSRLTSAVMGVGVVWLVYRIGTRLLGGLAGLFAAGLGATSVPILFYSHLENLEIPYVFWSVLAFRRFLLAFDRPERLAFWFWAAVPLALAVATKDQAAGLFLFLPVAVGLRGVRVRAAWKGGLLALATSIVVYGVASLAFFDWSGYTTHVRYLFEEGSKPFRQFPATAWGAIALAREVLLFIGRVHPWPVLLAFGSGLGAVVLRRPRRALLLLLPVISYFLGVLAPIGYVYLRFTLPVVVALSLAGGGMLAWLWNPAGGRLSRAACRAAILAVLAVSLYQAIETDLLFRKDPRYEAEEWIARTVPEGEGVLLVSGQPISLLRLPPALDVRPVASGSLRAEDIERGLPWIVLIRSRRYVARKDEGEPPRARIGERVPRGDPRYEVVAIFRSRADHPLVRLVHLHPEVAILESLGGRPAGDHR